MGKSASFLMLPPPLSEKEGLLKSVSYSPVRTKMVAERKMQPPSLKDIVKGRVGACGIKIRNIAAGARLHLLLAV